jgi:hypothetical protein
VEQSIGGSPDVGAAPEPRFLDVHSSTISFPTRVEHRCHCGLLVLVLLLLAYTAQVFLLVFAGILLAVS